MNAAELRHTMHAIGCPTEQRLADRIGVTRSCVSRWVCGRPIPRYIAMLLRLLEREAT